MTNQNSLLVTLFITCFIAIQIIESCDIDSECDNDLCFNGKCVNIMDITKINTKIQTMKSVDERLLKPRSGGYCTSNGDCHMLSLCSENTCKPKPMFKFPTGFSNGQSIKLIDYRVPKPRNEGYCTSDEDCHVHSQCFGNTCESKLEFSNNPIFQQIDARFSKPENGGYCTSDDDCHILSTCSENTCVSNYDNAIKPIESRFSKPRAGGYCTSNEDCYVLSTCSGNTCKDNLMFKPKFNPILGNGEISTSEVPDPNNELFKIDCSYDGQCKPIHPNAVCYREICMCYITEYSYKRKKMTYVNNITYCGSTMMVQSKLTVTGFMLLIIISMTYVNI